MNATSPQTPPIEITTEEGDGHDHEYSVWSSITRPDGVDINARVAMPCDATVGDLARALLQVAKGAAATFGAGLDDQVGMRIVDPDAAPMTPAGPPIVGGMLTVSMCDQILEQARENGVAAEDVRIQLNGHPLRLLDVRHVLDAIGLR